MIVLIVASSIHWGKFGIQQLKQNWDVGRSESPDPRSVAREIFYGICLGMLGLTGFECTPSYIARIKPGKFPLVLRNLHIPAIILNSIIMLLVLAVNPLEEVRSGANILSFLAQMTAGRWLRTWIVVDAIIVLCGGVLTGILSACGLLDQLANHRVIPGLFHRLLPITRSPYVAVLFFVSFSGMLHLRERASRLFRTCSHSSGSPSCPSFPCPCFC